MVKWLQIMKKSVGSVVWMQVFNKFDLFKSSKNFPILLWNINNSTLVKKIEN